MGDQYGMCPAFGNDTLAYVSGGIEIEVGEVTNQYIRPVGLRLCHILSGRVFQVAVGAEVNHCICLESFLHIQIRSQVAVGRRYRHSMHQFELIISQCRAGWGKSRILPNCKQAMAILSSVTSRLPGASPYLSVTS